MGKQIPTKHKGLDWLGPGVAENPIPTQLLPKLIALNKEITVSKSLWDAPAAEDKGGDEKKQYGGESDRAGGPMQADFPCSHLYLENQEGLMPSWPSRPSTSGWKAILEQRPPAPLTKIGPNHDLVKGPYEHNSDCCHFCEASVWLF